MGFPHPHRVFESFPVQVLLRFHQIDYRFFVHGIEEAGDHLLTFYRFSESQWRSLRTTNAIERMQLEFRRRVKTQAALPNEGAVLRVFFGLWISGQMKLHRISGYRDIGGKEKAAA